MLEKHRDSLFEALPLLGVAFVIVATAWGLPHLNAWNDAREARMHHQALDDSVPPCVATDFYSHQNLQFPTNVTFRQSKVTYAITVSNFDDADFVTTLLWGRGWTANVAISPSRDGGETFYEITGQCGVKA